MNQSVHLGANEPGSRIARVTALVGLLMMLTFPMQPAHQFSDHFRADEARQTIERHTFLAQRPAGPTERIAQCAVRPALSVRIAIPSEVNPPPASEFTSDIPLIRLLLRLKLGPSHTSAQDPFI
jgi:hypothetical protein